MKERELHIVDTTLRDGEQRAGIAFGVRDKVACARVMDSLGIYQIEAGIPAMCRQEQEAIYRILCDRRRARISTWNRMNENDIRASLELSPDIIHIGVPVSDIQIATKLRKTRAFVKDRMRRCIEVAASRGGEVTLGFEDASRADPDFVIRLALTAKELGVRRIRYADTLGICSPSGIGREIAQIVWATAMKVECHVHDDLGMAAANSLEAAKSGAEYIDTTFFGLGERAGNCNLVKFLSACGGIVSPDHLDSAKIGMAEAEIAGILNLGDNRAIRKGR